MGYLLFRKIGFVVEGDARHLAVLVDDCTRISNVCYIHLGACAKGKIHVVNLVCQSVGRGEGHESSTQAHSHNGSGAALLDVVVSHLATAFNEGRLKSTNASHEVSTQPTIGE